MLKKSDLAYKQEGEGTSHVYRLVLKPDNTARVEIDGEKIYEGSLKEDWELLAPKDRLYHWTQLRDNLCELQVNPEVFMTFRYPSEL